jgi:hypothetical protein
LRTPIRIAATANSIPSVAITSAAIILDLPKMRCDVH